MKISEIRTLQSGEIEGKLDNAREELFKLRFQITTGQMSDTSRLTMVKRDIARWSGPRLRGIASFRRDEVLPDE